MRLIDANTGRLSEFFGDQVPPYAILSHTWGENEVTLQHVLQNPSVIFEHPKIWGCCEKAVEAGFDYVWVDTCCIDKTSSAELTEAINSMFAWYERSGACYVYLSDVPPGEDPYLFDSSFRQSRWFTRGWTLQELLAPTQVFFFDQEWGYVEELDKNRGRDHTGMSNLTRLIFETKDVSDFTRLISEITGVNVSVLCGVSSIPTFSVATRMSWASKRNTTRIEDKAYSLLGIFGVNMPMLYGEGHNAFIRLQEEIIRRSPDLSVLAWSGSDYSTLATPNGSTHCVAAGLSLLAAEPSHFASSRTLRYSKKRGAHYTLTNMGLLGHFRLFPLPLIPEIRLLLLDSCNDGAENVIPENVAIVVALEDPDNDTQHVRAGDWLLSITLALREKISFKKPQQIYISAQPSVPTHTLPWQPELVPHIQVHVRGGIDFVSLKMLPVSTTSRATGQGPPGVIFYLKEPTHANRTVTSFLFIQSRYHTPTTFSGGVLVWISQIAKLSYGRPPIWSSAAFTHVRSMEHLWLLLLQSEEDLGKNYVWTNQAYANGINLKLRWLVPIQGIHPAPLLRLEILLQSVFSEDGNVDNILECSTQGLYILPSDAEERRGPARARTEKGVWETFYDKEPLGCDTDGPRGV